jgi:glycosyltransferase involved in cell wall biosynthesis
MHKLLKLAQPEKWCQSVERQGFAPLSICYDPRRVDILIDYRPALRQRTGVGEYVHGLASALATLLRPEDSLTLISSSWKDRLQPVVVPGTGQVDVRIPVRILNFAWHRLEWPPVEWLAPSADVVHSLHPLLIPSRSAAQLITIHDLYFLDRPDETTAEIRRDYPVLASRHASRADGIVVNSKHTGQQVSDRFGVPPDRITVCYPGRPDWPRRGDTTAPGPILFVGTAEPRKNLARLVQAYAALVQRSPNIPDLVIAGAVPDNGAAVLAANPALGPIRSRVKVTGYVTDLERQRLYRDASLLVLPSLTEGFGITALEAMTVGVPVVASRRGALPEVVGDAGILIDPENVVDLSNALERVLSDEGLRRSMAERGVLRARQFSWTESAERLYDAYQTAHRRRSTR